MIEFKDIQKQIDEEFNKFLGKLLLVGKQQRKYYYWSLDFFTTIGGLSFQYFPLDFEQKEKINQFGSVFFKREEVSFEINKNSDRHDLQIRNFNKLFSEETKAGQGNRYEYLKEYILWQILRDMLPYQFVSEEIVGKQKNNFLITYITYLLNHTKRPNFVAFKEYIKYDRTKQGQKLTKKLDELDREYIYDSKEGKEIKKIDLDQNSKLRSKIEKLYISKSQDSKIHFVFSHEGDEGKEELRELLDIMGGKDDSDHLYRGQANSSWGLDASITREPKYLSNESQLYYDILSLKPDAFKEDTSVYERLITMQHYGMPTRLLDVSRNPLVAIFFACNNMESAECDGTIFIFAPPKDKFLNFEDKRLKCLVKIVESEEKTEICRNCYNSNECPKGVQKTKNEDLPDFFSENWFVKGVAKNQRINSQSGDFIFVGLNGSQQKLATLPSMTIIIDSDSKEVLLQQLETINIHGGSVYPDITHMSNYIRKKYDKPVKLKSIEPEKQTKSEEAAEKAVDKAIDRVKEIVQKKYASKPFDFDSIKNKDRGTQISIFVKFYNLNEDGLEKLIQDFLFTERSPFRDEVAKIMNDNPSVLKERAKIDIVLNDIITLAKVVGKKKA